MDLVKLNNRIRLLEEGKTLKMVHQGYGVYEFKMNPQRNRIFATPVSTSSKAFEASCERVDKHGIVIFEHTSISKSPEKFLLWGHGDWYLETKAPSVEYITVKTDGEYEKV